VLYADGKVEFLKATTSPTRLSQLFNVPRISIAVEAPETPAEAKRGADSQSKVLSPAQPTD
jgi:hypothetical protein